MHYLIFPILLWLFSSPALATVIQRQDRPTVNNTRTLTPSITRRVHRPAPKPKAKPVAKKHRPKLKRRTIAKPAIRRQRKPRRTAYRSAPPPRKAYRKPPRRSYRRPPVAVPRSSPQVPVTGQATVPLSVTASPVAPQAVPKPVAQFHSHWRWPLPVDARITSRFGWSKDRRRFHSGLTLAANSGVQVTSVAAGRVAFAGGDDNYGLSVVVDHGEYRIRYSHLSAIQAQVGHRVVRGQALGLTGATGNIDGPRLGLEYQTRQADGSFKATDSGISFDVARVRHVQADHLARTRR